SFIDFDTPSPKKRWVRLKKGVSVMAENVYVPPIGAVAPHPGLPSRHALKRAALVLATLAGTAAIAYFGYDYWTVGRFLESTDDAYVTADYTTVAPKISGYIADVLVRDNEPVNAGQLLARIDDRDFKAALDQAHADVAAANAAIRNFDAQLVLQQ